MCQKQCSFRGCFKNIKESLEMSLRIYSKILKGNLTKVDEIIDKESL